MCVVDHLHLKYFVAAERHTKTPKVFWPTDARAEPCGALLCDNEDEKRQSVRGSNVYLIEPEQMDTSPTSIAIGIASR